MAFASARLLGALAIVSGTFLSVLSSTILNVPIPVIAHGFNATIPHTALLVTTSSVTFAAFLPLGDWLGNRFGRRNVYIAAISLYGLTALLAVFAPSLSVLVAIRIVQGVAAAGIVPLVMTLLSDLFDAGDRPRALSAWASANSAGQACGPPLGGVLAAAFGWRSIFIPTVILAALSCALAFRYLPADRKHATAPLDWSAALALTLGVILLLGALAAVPQLGPTSPAVLAALVLGLGSIALFVRAIRRAAHPFVSPHAFRDFDYRSSCTSVFAATVALGASLLAIPLYLIQSAGLSVALAGFVVLGLPLAMAIVAPFSSGLVHRFGTRRTMALTSAALALSGAVLMGCVALRLAPLTLLPAMILMGAAAATSYTAAAVAITQSAVGRIGAGLGLFNLLRIAGASVGAALVAIVLRYDANGYPTVFALACAVAIVALVTGDPLARRAPAG